MSKKKYDWESDKFIGCNTTMGWLLTAEQVAMVRHYLFLAGMEFEFEARRRLRDGMPKKLILHSLRKYRETQKITNELHDIKPYAYVRA